MDPCGIAGRSGLLKTRFTCIATIAMLMLGCAETPETPDAPETEDETTVTEWRGYTSDEMESFRSEIDLDNWDDGGEISRFTFLNTAPFFPTDTIERAGPVAALEYAEDPAIGSFPVSLDGDRTTTFDDYVDGASIDGIVILQGGRIAYEKYPRMRSDDRHILFSLSKVYVSTLVAILEDRGLLLVDEPVERYIPELASGGWRGVKVRDILDMASGIDAREWVDGAYTNPERKHYQYEASLGWLSKTESMPESVHRGSTYDFLANLGQLSNPGTTFDYISVNSAVLGWLVEKMTGNSFAEVLSDEIWSQIGAEADGQITLNDSGRAAVHAGIVASLRDVARFGLLFTPSHPVVNAEGLISDAYLQKIQSGGREELMEESPYSDQVPRPRYVSYQWQVYGDGSFFKGGFAGQGLYIDPDKDIVLAFVGTHGYGEVSPSPLEACLKMFAELY